MPSVVVAQPTPRQDPGGTHVHGRSLHGHSGALRRAGWSVVACRRCGEPQVSGLQGSAERRAAWAMAGFITMDPLTLHIDWAVLLADHCVSENQQHPKA